MGSCVLVCLRFAYLVAVRIVPTLRLWWRGDDHKTIEILLLRQQLAVLQRQLAASGKRPRPNWADRAMIALLLGLVPKARRAGLSLIVTPDRDLLRRRWAKKSRPKNGRPATHRNIKTLVLRLARQNPEWGYRRIHGELVGLGIVIAASTVWEILKNAGVDRAPRRGTITWADFLRSQAQGILAADFFTADLLEAPRSTFWPSSSTPAAGSASWAPPCTRPATGPRRWLATCSWNSKTRP